MRGDCSIAVVGSSTAKLKGGEINGNKLTLCKHASTLIDKTKK
jgi:hypothetical protein